MCVYDRVPTKFLDQKAHPASKSHEIPKPAARPRLSLPSFGPARSGPGEKWPSRAWPRNFAWPDGPESISTLLCYVCIQYDTHILLNQKIHPALIPLSAFQNPARQRSDTPVLLHPFYPPSMPNSPIQPLKFRAPTSCLESSLRCESPLLFAVSAFPSPLRQTL